MSSRRHFLYIHLSLRGSLNNLSNPSGNTNLGYSALKIQQKPEHFNSIHSPILMHNNDPRVPTSNAFQDIIFPKRIHSTHLIRGNSFLFYIPSRYFTIRVHFLQISFILFIIFNSSYFSQHLRVLCLLFNGFRNRFTLQ